MFAASDLFNLKQTEYAHLFENGEPPWKVLPLLKDFLETAIKPTHNASVSSQAIIGERVYLGEGTIVEHGACIEGPAIIGNNCQIRHGAYIRSHVIIGSNCVIGNSSELKNCLLFNDCQVPHFNYVGDSILGHHAHLGAGVVLSNLKSVPGNVMVNGHDTGLRKFGALVGDHAELGCNSVLNPGSVIGKNSVVYPNMNWRGVLPANQIAKNLAQQQVVERASSTK
tara:strand:+ start:619 stop:1293 length:675 start_codon:yes stop_codon:yes gene_type:complete